VKSIVRAEVLVPQDVDPAPVTGEPGSRDPEAMEVDGQEQQKSAAGEVGVGGGGASLFVVSPVIRVLLACQPAGTGEAPAENLAPALESALADGGVIDIARALTAWKRSREAAG
jgi:hypothetical protein